MRIPNWQCAVLLAFAIPSAGATGANAQANAEHFYAVQCIPKMDYFYFRNFTIVDQPNSMKNADFLRTKYGIHSISDLRKGAVVCQLPKHRIEVSGNYYLPPGRGECGAAETAEFSISLDGEKIAPADSSRRLGGCEADRFFVEVDINGVTVCTAPFIERADEQVTNEMLACSKVRNWRLP